MLRKFGTLISMQMSEKFKRGTTASYKAGQIAKTIGYAGVSYGLFVAIFYLSFNFLGLRPSLELFTFVIGVLQIVSIISCVISATKILYTSKDNMLLLTYPVKHNAVFASKMVVLYIFELLKSVYLNLPMFMAYMTVNSSVFSINYLISAFAYSIFIPLFPVLLGSIISIPVVFISKVFKKSSIIKGIFTAILFGGMIALTILLTNFIRSLPPLRIVAEPTKYNNQAIAFFSSFNRFTLYANFIGKGMLSENIKNALIYHLLNLACVIGIGVIALLISLPTFYKLASSASESATEKNHKGKNKAHKSTFATFTRKELTLSIRNIGNFASDYLFLFLMPSIITIVTVLYEHIDRNAVGYAMTYGFIGLLILIMLCASNTASATAISSEGTEFVLLKTAPGKTSNIIWSKLIINFIVSFVMTALSLLVMYLILKPDFDNGNLDLLRVLVVFVYVVLIEAGLLLWSIQLDIVKPRLREFANSQDKSEIKSTSTSIVIGLIFSIFFSALLILLFLTTLPLWMIAVILIAVALVFFGLRFYFLIQYRNAFFEDIQLWTRNLSYSF